MSGGIVQLVATGAQDTWLTGKPEISFFRSNYKRYTHYALSSERQIIQGNPSAGSISTIRFEKKGDLLSYVYFIGKDTTGALIPGVDWSKVVDKIELLIGGQVVDTQDITWMTQVEPVTGAQNYSQRYLNNDLTGLTNVINGFLPLKFFFCKDWSVALPLVALQYHDVELRITWSQNLGYRVNYEIYSINNGGSGVVTATAQANPITGSGASAPAGYNGAMTMTISHPGIVATLYQPTAFTYSSANFQLVPGMTFTASSGSAATTIAGLNSLTVISVSATTTTSGSFFGIFTNNGAAYAAGTTAATAGALTSLPVYAYATTPYSTTTATPTTFGTPFVLTACTVPGGAGYTQALTAMTGFNGYPALGMSCTSLPGAGGATGYITAITTSATIASTAITVSFAGQQTITSISGATLGFSAPAAFATATLTPVQNPNVTGSSAPSFTPTFGTGGTAGQLISVAVSGGGTALVPGTYLATFTLATQTSPSSFSFVVRASDGTVVAVPSVIAAGTGVLTGAQSAITNSAITYSAYGTTVSYTLAASAVQNGVIFPGQTLPQSNAATGTSGTGYVTSVIPGNIIGPATATQAGYVGSIIVTYAATQTISGTTAVAGLLNAPVNTTFTTTGGRGNSGAVATYTTLNAGSGFITIGMSVTGMLNTTGVGYVIGVNGATSTAIVLPGSQTSVAILFPAANPVTTTTDVTNQAALAPIGTVQSTVVGTVTYTNVPIYGLGPGIAPITVNSVITSNAPAGTGAGLFLVSAISYQSPGVALATITLWGTPSASKPVVPTITVATLLTGATAPTFTPSFPVVNMLLTTTGPSGTIPANATILGHVTGTMADVPLATVNTVYGPIQGFGYMVSINSNQQNTSGMPASTQDGYYTNIALAFVPSIYYCGIISQSGGTGAFTITGGTNGPLTVSQATIAGTPPASTYFYTINSSTGTATNLSNPTVASSTNAPALSISYTKADNSGTTFARYTQFALIPTSSIFAQLSGTGQPGVDRQGAAIISLAYVSGSVNIAVGQAVINTIYTGPVTVSQVIATSGTRGGLSTDTATIEISFPVQSVVASTATGAGTFIQFVDPTQPLPSTVTVSNTGFNGTYQQLQYEAWCSYLYLDGAEREYFASTPMDMLITQINRVPINPLSTHEVNLAHPVKFLAFVSNSYATAYATQATTGISAASYQFKTQLNGVDVGDTRALFQWQDVPQYYHTPFGYKAATGTAPVAIISYCLDTSKLQPTGTLNFSRLDSYRIITPSNSSLAQIAGGTSGYIYAVNYNILRIQKGMGSMLYSS